MATSARASFVLRRLADLSTKQQPPPPLPLLPRRLLSVAPRRGAPASSSAATVSCLGGGVSDDFVSTRKSSLDRGFSVIANMLKRIEPLDNSVISKGVSDSARDSMKQTISAMLGLLPSDQFAVTIHISEQPLRRLLVSSVITGYTLWNAEYRMSLMRNFDSSLDSSVKRDLVSQNDVSQVEGEERQSGDESDVSVVDMEGREVQIFGDLSPEALNYIQQLQSELDVVKEELNSHKKGNMRIQLDKESSNDLLNYLRSLDSDMVNELSHPSSTQVEEIIQQLVQNILRKFLKDKMANENAQEGNDELFDVIGTSRDNLAKLLFWFSVHGRCMLLGHHLRGLENRLQLSCVVGLL
ncbi:hypothetical protein EUGRSUZ_J02163 [Eucalyptus grandis]|uniref:Uncharacterized protein n=2 Tax=Eucalyptus grandis TaxID=71139 RepID=A0ACC3J7Q0_EUCGR|nr:hypothetical protein EUGRSUZ_J02163 [Eucalyptus grandis]